MRIVSVIQASVDRVPEIKQFIHATQFLNNVAADNGIEYPAAFLVRPVTVNPVVTDSGALTERARCQIFFADLQGILLDEVGAHAVIDPKIEAMRIAMTKFFVALQEHESTKDLVVNQYRDTFNFFDGSLCGVLAEFQITLRVENPYPCPDYVTG